MVDTSIEVSVQPHSCVCPTHNYTCQADNVFIMRWTSESLTEPISHALDLDTESEIQRDDIYVKFIETSLRVRGVVNLTSNLFITDLSVNETNITCVATSNVGSTDNETITMCVTGKTFVQKQKKSFL